MAIVKPSSDAEVIKQLKALGFSDDINETPRRLVASLSGKAKTGKCLAGDCTVLLESGEVKDICDLSSGMRISSITPEGSNVIAVVKTVAIDGVRPIIRVRLSDGRRIKVTSEHKFFTHKGWVEAEALHMGDRVLVPRVLEVVHGGSGGVSDDEATVLGYLIADGGLSSSSVRFTKGDIFVMNDFKSAATRLGFNLADYTYGDKTDTVGLSGLSFQLFRKRFHLRATAAYKVLPDEFFAWTVSAQDAFLRSYFTCDGWICTTTSGGIQFGACSASKVLITQLTDLLLCRGIPVTTRVRRVEGCDYWELDGATASTIEFVRAVGFIGEKQHKSEDLIRNLKVKPKAQGYASRPNSHGVHNRSSGESAIWIRVKGVDRLGIDVLVYDVELDGDLQCFVANNILVHNTHFSLTGPGPIIYFNVDIGTEGVVEKFQLQGKQILMYDVRVPKEASKDVWSQMWTDFKVRVRKAYAIRVGTVVWDTATEVYELARLSHFGRLTEVKPSDYAVVNNEWREVLRIAYDSPMNTIFIHKVKAMWKMVASSSGRSSLTKTDDFEVSGFSEIDYLVQTNLSMNCVYTDKGPEFSCFVKDCRQNPNVAGTLLEGDLCNFNVLLDLVHGEEK